MEFRIKTDKIINQSNIYLIEEYNLLCLRRKTQINNNIKFAFEETNSNKNNSIDFKGNNKYLY
jgi:hypothetical protein